MSQTTQDIDVFKLTAFQNKEATLYHRQEDNQTYIYVGPEKYIIPDGTLAFALPGEVPLEEKFQGFRFNEDVRLEGQTVVWQMDEHYMVVFATEAFTDTSEGALNDVILLCVGNALTDVENY